MKCHSVTKLFQPFIDRVLSPDIAEDMKQHLESCTSCQKELAAQTNLITALSTLKQPRLSDIQWQSIHDNVLNALPEIDRTRNRILTFPGVNKRFAFTALKAAAALFIISLVSFSLIFTLKNNSSITAGLFNKNSSRQLAEVHGTVYSASGIINKTFSMTSGSSIQTDSFSTAAIQVDAKTTLGLSRSTYCKVKTYSENSAIFAMTQGALEAEVSKRKENQIFRIETPNAFCEVIGTRFDITTRRTEPEGKYITTLIVHEGIVKFGSENRSTFVKAGNGIALLGDSLSTEFNKDDQLFALITSDSDSGLLTLSSEPAGATVYIDDVHFGSTPLNTPVSRGVHVIRVEKNGYKTWNDNVIIHSFAGISRSATLEKRKRNAAKFDAPSVADNSDNVLDNPHFQSALALMSKGSYKQAINVLHKLIRTPGISPDLEAASYQKLGICYKNSGNVESAFIIQNKIINGAYPSAFKATALFERATLYHTSFHDTRSAIKDFEQYVSENRNGLWVEEATLSLAQLLRLSGEFKHSAEMYSKFCSSYKNSIHYEKALYTMATIYYANLSDCSRAVKAFNQLLHEKPQCEFVEDAIFWSADCQLRLGHPSSALEAFNSYLKKYPSGKWAAETNNRIHTMKSVEAR